jgi:hypothetical protein
MRMAEVRRTPNTVDSWLKTVLKETFWKYGEDRGEKEAKNFLALELGAYI